MDNNRLLNLGGVQPKGVITYVGEFYTLVIDFVPNTLSFSVALHYKDCDTGISSLYDATLVPSKVEIIDTIRQWLVGRDADEAIRLLG